MRRIAIEARSRARHQLLQALYQWQMSGDSPDSVYRNRLLDPQHADIDEEYFTSAFNALTTHQEHYETLLAPLLARNIEQLDPIERAILWIGTYEIKDRSDIHPTVSINEAVELAKRFGAEGSYKFINVTLDKLSKTCPSPHELSR
ncbi:MAG: transcription antitermination factor NusB [Cardiobacteriaceae bacterium]|nr:transcription antitermination factor NusB [Cardiobacteriaceae bacterium]